MTLETQSGDRNNLSLWHNGDALIQSAVSSYANVVVVIHAPGPVDMEKWIDHPNVKAVLFAGMPGQESGNSLVDILWGTVNPVGQFTIPLSSCTHPFTAVGAASFHDCEETIRLPRGRTLHLEQLRTADHLQRGIEHRLPTL